MPANLFEAMYATAVGTMPSDHDGVDQLLRMEDDVVRQKVGDAFIAQMQNSARVQVFFASPENLLAPIPVKQNQKDWIGEVASALVALSLGHTSAHGFSASVDLNNAQKFLNSNLIPSNSDFVAVPHCNYQMLFPAYCQTKDTSPVTFQSFLQRGKDQQQKWGSLLAKTLASQTMSTRS